jgi:predicted nucleic acid-binding protein
MKVFLDTNILMDILGRREPFYDSAAQIGTMVETGKLNGIVSAISVATVFYLLRRHSGISNANLGLRWIRGFFTIASCDDKVIFQAMDAGWRDFEDAIQYFCACRADANCLITRNEEHFEEADLAVMSPKAFLTSLSEK